MMKSTSGFNNLKKWLIPRLEERRISVEHLALNTGVGRRTIYSWLDDTVRPTTQTAAKVVHYLSKLPAWDTEGDNSVLIEIPLEEMLAQYTERRNGRPPKSGSTHEVRTRSR